jgi:hypothetical protein
MRIACWIPKATDTHSEYVIVVAFPQQQWLHERVSQLGCTYIAVLVIVFKKFTNVAADGTTQHGGPQFGHLWFDPREGGSKLLQNVSKYYQCIWRKNPEN